MNLLFGHDEAVAKFVARLIPGMERGFSANKAIGVINGAGELVAGMVYHNWEPEAGIIEMSGASIDPRWLTRPVLQFMYDYPFLTCGCQMLVQRNAADNERLNRQLRRWGYNEYPIPRMRGKDRDGILFTFHDDQWERHPCNLRNAGKALEV